MTHVKITCPRALIFIMQLLTPDTYKIERFQYCCQLCNTAQIGMLCFSQCIEFSMKACRLIPCKCFHAEHVFHMAPVLLAKPQSRVLTGPFNR